MFELLSVNEWDRLCSMLERAMLPLSDDDGLCRELAGLHGELMTGWQARVMAGEWSGTPDLVQIPTGTGWPA